MIESGSIVLQMRRYRISGRVQGVFFRASARQRASQLGVTGHAINLADGSVEVLACGSAGQLDQLAAWLRQGPPAARVSSVELLEQCDDVQVPKDFVTG